jgi:hypothetical protein
MSSPSVRAAGCQEKGQKTAQSDFTGFCDLALIATLEHP